LDRGAEQRPIPGWQIAVDGRGRGLAAEDFLRRCGYRSAVTTAEGCNTKGVSLYRLRRLQIGDSRSISSFAFNVGRLFLEVPSESPVDSAAAATRQARREELRGMER